MDTVSQPANVVMWQLGLQRLLRVTLAYDRKEPFGVKILFPSGLQYRYPDLVLARELLASGTVEPATFGCMRVWPLGGDTGTVCIGWEVPEGDTRLEIPTIMVTCFLDMAYYLVPEGCEPGRTDIDATITAILTEGGAR